MIAYAYLQLDVQILAEIGAPKQHHLRQNPYMAIYQRSQDLKVKLTREHAHVRR